MTSQERHVLGEHGDHNQTDVREESSATIQLREEQLAARKHAVETGQVSVGTEVVEQQQTLEVR